MQFSRKDKDYIVLEAPSDLSDATIARFLELLEHLTEEFQRHYFVRLRRYYAQRFDPDDIRSEDEPDDLIPF